MARIKRGVTKHARHKGIIKLAKGYRGRSKNVYQVALGAVENAMEYAYRDRRTRKRDFRKLWIMRINSASREHGLTYSKLINGLTKANFSINRKMLAELAVNNKEMFTAIVEKAKSAL